MTQCAASQLVAYFVGLTAALFNAATRDGMPPIANGCMQRGTYGRAQSPYNAAYLTAPFASDSSNVAATATAVFLSVWLYIQGLRLLQPLSSHGVLPSQALSWPLATHYGFRTAALRSDTLKAGHCLL
jgi:hypothetical protein